MVPLFFNYIRGNGALHLQPCLGWAGRLMPGYRILAYWIECWMKITFNFSISFGDCMPCFYHSSWNVLPFKRNHSDHRNHKVRAVDKNT